MMVSYATDPVTAMRPMAQEHSGRAAAKTAV